MSVAFGLQCHLAHGMSFRSSGLHGGQHLIQPVVILRQGLPQHRKPLIDLGNAVRRQPAGAFCALDAADDQPGALEHFQVAGDGRLRHVERPASSITVASPSARRARIARRVGSASAEKVASRSGTAAFFIYATYYITYWLW